MSALTYHVVIPARLSSSRFHAKPLAPILGQAMITHTIARARASQAQEVVVATDSEEIAAVVRAVPSDVHMTDVAHPSGTDRIAQVARERGWSADTIIVNVQGDEPAINPALIHRVAEQLHATPSCVMATAAHPLTTWADFLNPNMVKVVLDDAQRALYFSRAPIPYPRDFMGGAEDNAALPSELVAYRHMGIYAYRVGFLLQYGDLAASELERLESLEQLRVLAHGHQIAVAISHEPAAPGVDVPADVALVEAYWRAQGQTP